MRSILDHNLGSDWEVAELTNDYDHGGTLKVYIASDLEVADMSRDPYAGSSQYSRTILLDDAPDIPANHDFVVIWFDDGESITGSLDGVAGSFSCANPGGCYFIDDVQPGEAYPSSPSMAFTPDIGGAAEPLPVEAFAQVSTVDYLAFGHWLYVPDDVTATEQYEFGVFGSGGDPFNAANLAGLTGTATYDGDAVGMYYVNALSSSREVGSFAADVQLNVDFGNGSETGFVSGEVNNFEFEGDVASLLPTSVQLNSYTFDYLPDGFGVPRGSTNIFDTPWRAASAAYPGGWAGGATYGSTDGADWYGEWSSVFYGNGSSSTDHPTSVAGQFGNYVWGAAGSEYRGQRSAGLAGAFGAHKQP